MDTFDIVDKCGYADQTKEKREEIGRMEGSEGYMDWKRAVPSRYGPEKVQIEKSLSYTPSYSQL